jgi:hypothetical protein
MKKLITICFVLSVVAMQAQDLPQIGWQNMLNDDYSHLSPEHSLTLAATTDHSGVRYVLFGDASQDVLEPRVMSFDQDGSDFLDLGIASFTEGSGVSHPTICCRDDRPTVAYRHGGGQGQPKPLYVTEYVDGSWQYLGTNPVMSDDCQQGFIGSTIEYTVLVGVSLAEFSSRTFVLSDGDWLEIQPLEGKADDVIANPHDGYFYAVTRTDQNFAIVWRLKPFEDSWEQVGLNQIPGAIGNRIKLRIQEMSNTIWVVPGASFACHAWRLNTQTNTWEAIGGQGPSAGVHEVTFANVGGAEVPLRICQGIFSTDVPVMSYLSLSEEWIDIPNTSFSQTKISEIHAVVKNGVTTIVSRERGIRLDGNQEVIADLFRARNMVLAGVDPQQIIVINDNNPDSCVGDENGDGVVNAGDLALLLSVFGTVCP